MFFNYLFNVLQDASTFFFVVHLFGWANKSAVIIIATATTAPTLQYYLCSPAFFYLLPILATHLRK